jgi:hypothetical protein
MEVEYRRLKEQGDDDLGDSAQQCTRDFHTIKTINGKPHISTTLRIPSHELLLENMVIEKWEVHGTVPGDAQAEFNRTVDVEALRL